MFNYPGAWKSYDDVESCVSMSELSELLEKARELVQLDRKFAAAIQGIDLDKESSKDSEFEQVRLRAEARARGVTEDEVALDGLIDFVDEDELE